MFNHIENKTIHRVGLGILAIAILIGLLTEKEINQSTEQTITTAVRSLCERVWQDRTNTRLNEQLNNSSEVQAIISSLQDASENGPNPILPSGPLSHAVEASVMQDQCQLVIAVGSETSFRNVQALTVDNLAGAIPGWFINLSHAPGNAYIDTYSWGPVSENRNYVSYYVHTTSYINDDRPDTLIGATDLAVNGQVVKGMNHQYIENIPAFFSPQGVNWAEVVSLLANS